MKEQQPTRRYLRLYFRAHRLDQALILAAIALPLAVISGPRVLELPWIPHIAVPGVAVALIPASMLVVGYASHLSSPLSQWEEHTRGLSSTTARRYRRWILLDYGIFALTLVFAGAPGLGQQLQLLQLTAICLCIYFLLSLVFPVEQAMPSAFGVVVAQCFLIAVVDHQWLPIFWPARPTFAAVWSVAALVLLVFVRRRIKLAA